MAVNKVVLNGEILLDLTGDTVTQETLARGTTAHDAAGRLIEGVMEGGMEAVKLWENASPTSIFPAQTLAIDLTGFDSLLVEFKNHRTAEVYSTFTMKAGGKMACMTLTTGGLTSSGYKNYIAIRTLKHEETGVTFGYGTYTNRLTGGTQSPDSSENNYMIPMRIYGMRGMMPG